MEETHNLSPYMATEKPSIVVLSPDEAVSKAFSNLQAALQGRSDEKATEAMQGLWNVRQSFPGMFAGETHAKLVSLETDYYAKLGQPTESMGKALGIMKVQTGEGAFLDRERNTEAGASLVELLLTKVTFNQEGIFERNRKAQAIEKHLKEALRSGDEAKVAAIIIGGLRAAPKLRGTNDYLAVMSALNSHDVWENANGKFGGYKSLIQAASSAYSEHPDLTRIAKESTSALTRTSSISPARKEVLEMVLQITDSVTQLGQLKELREAALNLSAGKPDRSYLKEFALREYLSTPDSERPKLKNEMLSQRYFGSAAELIDVVKTRGEEGNRRALRMMGETGLTFFSELGQAFSARQTGQHNMGQLHVPRGVFRLRPGQELAVRGGAIEVVNYHYTKPDLKPGGNIQSISRPASAKPPTSVETPQPPKVVEINSKPAPTSALPKEPVMFPPRLTIEGYMGRERPVAAFPGDDPTMSPQTTESPSGKSRKARKTKTPAKSGAATNEGKAKAEEGPGQGSVEETKPGTGEVPVEANKPSSRSNNVEGKKDADGKNAEPSKVSGGEAVETKAKDAQDPPAAPKTPTPRIPPRPPGAPAAADKGATEVKRAVIDFRVASESARQNIGKTSEINKIDEAIVVAEKVGEKLPAKLTTDAKTQVEIVRKELDGLRTALNARVEEVKQADDSAQAVDTFKQRIAKLNSIDEDLYTRTSTETQRSPILDMRDKADAAIRFAGKVKNDPENLETHATEAITQGQKFADDYGVLSKSMPATATKKAAELDVPLAQQESELAAKLSGITGSDADAVAQRERIQKLHDQTVKLRDDLGILRGEPVVRMTQTVSSSQPGFFERNDGSSLFREITKFNREVGRELEEVAKIADPTTREARYSELAGKLKLERGVRDANLAEYEDEIAFSSKVLKSQKEEQKDRHTKLSQAADFAKSKLDEAEKGLKKARNDYDSHLEEREDRAHKVKRQRILENLNPATRNEEIESYRARIGDELKSTQAEIERIRKGGEPKSTESAKNDPRTRVSEEGLQARAKRLTNLFDELAKDSATAKVDYDKLVEEREARAHVQERQGILEKSNPQERQDALETFRLKINRELTATQQELGRLRSGGPEQAIKEASGADDKRVSVQGLNDRAKRLTTLQDDLGKDLAAARDEFVRTSQHLVETKIDNTLADLQKKRAKNALPDKAGRLRLQHLLEDTNKSVSARQGEYENAVARRGEDASARAETLQASVKGLTAKRDNVVSALNEYEQRIAGSYTQRRITEIDKLIKAEAAAHSAETNPDLQKGVSHLERRAQALDGIQTHLDTEYRRLSEIDVQLAKGESGRPRTGASLSDDVIDFGDVTWTQDRIKEYRKSLDAHQTSVAKARDLEVQPALSTAKLQEKALKDEADVVGQSATPEYNSRLDRALDFPLKKGAAEGTHRAALELLDNALARLEKAKTPAEVKGILNEVMQAKTTLTDDKAGRENWKRYVTRLQGSSDRIEKGLSTFDDAKQKNPATRDIYQARVEALTSLNKEIDDRIKDPTPQSVAGKTSRPWASAGLGLGLTATGVDLFSSAAMSIQVGNFLSGLRAELQKQLSTTIADLSVLTDLANAKLKGAELATEPKYAEILRERSKLEADAVAKKNYLSVQHQQSGKANLDRAQSELSIALVSVDSGLRSQGKRLSFQVSSYRTGSGQMEESLSLNEVISALADPLGARMIGAILGMSVVGADTPSSSKAIANYTPRIASAAFDFSYPYSSIQMLSEPPGVPGPASKSKLLTQIDALQGNLRKVQNTIVGNIILQSRALTKLFSTDHKPTNPFVDREYERLVASDSAIDERLIDLDRLGRLSKLRDPIAVTAVMQELARKFAKDFSAATINDLVADGKLEESDRLALLDPGQRQRALGQRQDGVADTKNVVMLRPAAADLIVQKWLGEVLPRLNTEIANDVKVEEKLPYASEHWMALAPAKTVSDFWSSTIPEVDVTITDTAGNTLTRNRIVGGTLSAANADRISLKEGQRAFQLETVQAVGNISQYLWDSLPKLPTVIENSAASSLGAYTAAGAAAYGSTHLQVFGPRWAYYMATKYGAVARTAAGLLTAVPLAIAVAADVWRLKEQRGTEEGHTSERFGGIAQVRNLELSKYAMALQERYIEQMKNEMTARPEVALNQLRLEIESETSKLQAYATFQSTVGRLFETLKGYSQSDGSFGNVDPRTLRMLQTRLREAGERFNGTSSGGFMNIPAIPPPPPRLRPQQ